MAFADNVFVNCPFDDDFVPLLRPLLFTIIYLKLQPRIALERADSAEARIEKIIGLIAASKYGIHDLSRIKASKEGEYFRLNMPFELGLDVGCGRFKGGKASQKSILILEAEKYRYQAAISDISGSDIGVHGNEPERVVREVRNWLAAQCRPQAAGATRIWGAFNEFMAANFDELTEREFTPDEIEALPVWELIGHMQAWVAG